MHLMYLTLRRPPDSAMQCLLGYFERQSGSNKSQLFLFSFSVRYFMYIAVRTIPLYQSCSHYSKME